MADGVAITAGAGTTVWTDDLGVDGHVQGVKLLDGTENSTEVIAGTTANGLDVDVTRVQGTVTVDGSGVTQPVSHAALTELAAAIDTEVQCDIVGALPAGAALIGKVQLSDGTDHATVRDVTGAKSLDVSIVDGSGNQITSFGGGTQYTEGDTDATITGTAMLWEDSSDTLRAASATKPLPVTQVPTTANGSTIHRTLSAASTNSTNVKGSAGQLYGWLITSIDATPVYVKLYNKATAPTVGTDTPVMTLMVPGNTAGAGMVAAEFTNGIPFGTGIGFAITAAASDADTTAVAANEVIVHLFYK
jgi:hypothetical protein